MPPRRILALVDCNSFYASCENVFVPSLANKPVVVLSNNDGCVIARSVEAKAVGIPTGKPTFGCRELFRRHGRGMDAQLKALYYHLETHHRPPGREVPVREV